MNHDRITLNEIWGGIVGLLKITQESGSRLPLIYSFEKVPENLTKLAATDYSRQLATWTLAKIAGELWRAEDGQLSRTARMVYSDEEGDTRFLDTVIHPIPGWIIQNDGFLGTYATATLPSTITPVAEQPDHLGGESPGASSVYWEAVGRFYARVYDFVAPELPALINSVYADAEDCATSYVARSVSALTLASYVLVAYETTTTKQGIKFEVALSDGTTAPATPALSELYAIIGASIDGSRVSDYLHLWESDELERNPLIFRP